MGRVETKVPINGAWMKRVIDWRGTSLYALGRSKESGGIDWNIRTIRRAASEGAISPKLLDDLARALNVSPDYLAGKYSHTLEYPIMELEGVKEYWTQNYLNPDRFPYDPDERERPDAYQHLLDTLHVHGVRDDEYKKLDMRDRSRLEEKIDLAVTNVLKEWFPNCTRSAAIDYEDAGAWRDEQDVIEAMLDFLVEKGYVTVSD